MDVKEAVARAKHFLADVFSDETVSEIRLEEIAFDRSERAWLVTLGLLRPAGADAQTSFGVLKPVLYKRTYKIVRIPEDSNEMPSIKIREVSEG